MSALEALGLQAEMLGSRLKVFSDARVNSPLDWERWLTSATSGQHEGPADLPYVAAARAARAGFHALTSAHKLPADSKLQSSYPVAVARQWPEPFDRSNEIDVEFNACLIGQIERIVAAGPTNGTAIQLDLPFADLTEATDRLASSDADARRDHFIAAALTVMNAVPESADLALHFDCRDGARFSMVPADAEAMATIAQDIIGRASRAVHLVHLPVPLRHEDDAFFRGLAGLHLPFVTRLCLGLVHLSDGLEGARRRIKLARAHFDDFAIGARSGFAARATDTIRPFLALHAEVADDMTRNHGAERDR
jgi:hypothetical protein